MADRYYRPYRSDSESEASSDSDSETGSSFSSDTGSDTDTSSYAARVSGAVPPNFRALAEGLSFTELAGPEFDTSGAELNALVPSLGYPISGGFPTFKNLEVPADTSGNKISASKTAVNNIVMLDSADRDRSVFPQPTDVTLRLPRVYNNVTNFQLVQMKLLSAFLYFRNSKHNTDISILELNRTVPDSFGNQVPNIVKNFIREGSYDINGLLNELAIQLNYTPIFYDFPNGFQDFAPQFAATGNFALNFNFPGDYFYDSLLDQYIANPTTTLIVSKYFQNQYAGLSSYSTDQIKVAYYYPVVKEILLDPTYDQELNLVIPPSVAVYLLPTETVRSRCIYTFQGLNDLVVQQVILQNIPVLDTYRLKHTFRYSLINKYVLSYETQSNHVTISCPGLNTSLSNLITYKQNQYFAEQLSIAGITSNTYNQLQIQNSLLLAVLNDMFYFIERWLAVNFGVNFNDYTLDYLANPANLIPIQNAFQGTGISSNFDFAVLSKTTPPISNDILLPLKQSAKSYWNRLSNLPEPTQPFPFNLETGSPTTSSNYPYSILLEQQDRAHSFVDANGLFYNNKLTRHADIVVPIDATKYTIFQFKSPVRQTLQVETLPRPTQYRYPAYNAATYDVSQQVLFDNSYAFVQNAQNVALDVAANFSTTSFTPIPGFSTLALTTSNFGLSYASSIALWDGGAVADPSVQVGSTRTFFQFQTPLPPDYTSTLAPGYRYPLSLTLVGSSNPARLSTAMTAFVYHDRAAFMADVSDNRAEKPIHYITSATASTNTSSLTLSFQAYGNQTYYVLARSEATVPATQYFRVVPWFPSSFAYTAVQSTLAGFDPFADPQTAAALSNFNYATVADPAYIRLPIQSSIQTSTTQDALYSNIVYSTVAMGYDRRGVSTDLTHYCGYIAGAAGSNGFPAATLRLDPTTGYAFQVGQGYNSTAETYFSTTSSNVILSPQGATVYTPSTIAARQYTIAQWYGTNFLANSENQAPMLANQLADTSVITPYTSNTTNSSLSGYTYAGSNGAIQFGDGVCGFNFTPQEGVWDIQRFMFKSIYITSNAETDGNLNIRYIGVFPSGYEKTKYLHEFSLDDAIAVLKFSTATVYTASNQNLGFDPAGGTYYEYIRDPTWRSGAPSYLYGYTQIRSTINTDINATYLAMPFDAGKNHLFFQGLVGTPVPYPFYSDASAGTFYVDGSSAPNGKDIVIPVTKGSPDPTRGPPAGYDETQVKYEQSMTIGTNLLTYATPFPFLSISTSMKPWGPLPFSPAKIIADVSGYILTQDTNYRVFAYSGEETSTFTLTESYQFTLDQVYPASDPLINYIGCAASETRYAFFAYSNDAPVPTPGSSKLLIRTMRPADGTLTDAYEYANLPGFDPTEQQITNLTFNNFGGFTMAYQQGGSTFGVLSKHEVATSSMTFFSTLGVVGGSNANVDHLIVQQAPKEQFGAFYVFPYRKGFPGPISEGVIDFVKITPSNVIGSHDANYTYQALSGPQPTWGTGGAVPCQIEVFNLSNAPSQPQIYTQPIVTRDPYQEQLFALSLSSPTRIFQITSYSTSNVPEFTSNALTTPSAYEFPGPASNLSPGSSGAKWSLWGSTIFGNRQNGADAPRHVVPAWQLFYPVQRIVFTQVAKQFTFMHDLSGLRYPEYPHTALIGYDSYTNMVSDISGRWGLESSGNFVVGDFGFSGQTFNSYLFTFPLQSTTSNYYLAVRNYAPTEKSQVLMRVSVPNLYDFGYVSMTDLSGEVPLLSTSSNTFNPEYWAALTRFNANFIIDSNGRVFGSNIIQGYGGSNISSVTGFGDFYSRFLTIYNQYNSQVQLIQTINSNTNAAVVNFIETDLQYILPASALNRQRFTDPLTFSILWKSALDPQYAKLEDNWGLGWNLGYAKQDTPYETVQRADSFFKILDDYISLRLNPEFDMNHMDTGSKENLGITLEPTGATKAYHAKLLLANFGNFAQTMITNPIVFNPPLGRMDKIKFQWVDTTGAIIDNSDCEWNTVIQIVETKEVADFPTPMRVDPAARIAPTTR